MKNKFSILIGIIIIVCLGIGGKIYMDSKSLEEEMLTVVKGEEVKKNFEETLKNLDPLALIPEGKIQSYEIDYDSIVKNPMGGINVKLIINDDEKLSIEFTLNNNDKGLEAGGISYSYELDQLLKET